MIAGVVVLHVWALHVTGQNKPDRHPDQDRQGRRALHPLRDHQGRVRGGGVLRFFAYWIFLQPNYLGHADNYIRRTPP